MQKNSIGKKLFVLALTASIFCVIVLFVDDHYLLPQSFYYFWMVESGGDPGRAAYLFGKSALSALLLLHPFLWCEKDRGWQLFRNVFICIFVQIISLILIEENVLLQDVPLFKKIIIAGVATFFGYRIFIAFGLFFKKEDPAPARRSQKNGKQNATKDSSAPGYQTAQKGSAGGNYGKWASGKDAAQNWWKESASHAVKVGSSQQGSGAAAKGASFKKQASVQNAQAQSGQGLNAQKDWQQAKQSTSENLRARPENKGGQSNLLQQARKEQEALLRESGRGESLQSGKAWPKRDDSLFRAPNVADAALRGVRPNSSKLRADDPAYLVSSTEALPVDRFGPGKTKVQPSVDELHRLAAQMDEEVLGGSRQRKQVRPPSSLLPKV